MALGEWDRYFEIIFIFVAGSCCFGCRLASAPQGQKGKRQRTEDFQHEDSGEEEEKDDRRGRGDWARG